jgi:hypothetical protein
MYSDGTTLISNSPLAASLALAISLAPIVAVAQGDYPTKPIRVVVNTHSPITTEKDA